MVTPFRELISGPQASEWVSYDCWWLVARGRAAEDKEFTCYDARENCNKSKSRAVPS